jgi:hypothetical protein
LNGDRPILARVKYLCDYGTDNCNPVCLNVNGGGWSGRAEAQWRPRVSKLRAKGLSDYHSNETVVEAARRGTSGPKKGYSQDMFIQKRRTEKQLLVCLKKWQKAACHRKSTTVKN